jgi:hypothetical protein
MKEIITALVKAQKEMGNAVKDAKNPFFKSTYADLNSVREATMPILNNYGIAVLQPMVTVDGLEYVKTVLLHESGESIESFTKILCKMPNDPQAYGSGVTYARRYGLQSLLSIGASDDDGEKAMARNKEHIEEAPKEAYTEISNCKTLEELNTVALKYRLFATDPKFATAGNDKKNEIKTNLNIK